MTDQLKKYRVELYQFGTGRQLFIDVTATDYETAVAFGEANINCMPEAHMDLQDGYGEREMYWSVTAEEAK